MRTYQLTPLLIQPQVHGMRDKMEYNLIDPEDPNRKWVITIARDGKVISLKEEETTSIRPTAEKPMLRGKLAKFMEKGTDIEITS